jgi:peptidoglycan/LPS O-acetylase OafA/YrhL
MSGTTAAASDRFHALDAVRGFALLLGIAGHATLSFFTVPFWPIRDPDPTTALMSGFFIQHIFRMSLFFTIAGFFAHMMLHKSGARDFARDRLKRIALPLIVFWPLLFAAFIAVIVWSSIRTTGAPPPPPPGPGLTWETVPLLHTWFLYILLLLYVGMLAVVGLARLIDRQGRLAGRLDTALGLLARSHLLPFALAAPLALAFHLHSSWVPFGGIRTPDVGLVPSLPALIAFATAFGFGWLLNRQTELLGIWSRWWPLYLLAAIALTVAVMRASDDGPALVPGQEPAGADLFTAALYPLAIWAWSLGLIGLAMRLLTRENKVVRYLADSSYWLYLIHLPIVMMGQVVVAQWPVSAWLKFPLLLSASTAVMLASYQLLVRGSWIGAWLNGRRHGRRSQAVTSAGAVPAE